MRIITMLKGVNGRLLFFLFKLNGSLFLYVGPDLQINHECEILTNL